ncbi:AAA family ATPase [Agrobacterium rubi]|nr:AAA family ATPase [Agrobacterium rubi]NTF24837.1 AAA family ATPase [Agrobacterium rubi]
MAESQLRRAAEDIYAEELAALVKGDDLPRPTNWKLSPQAVATFVLGGVAKDGTPITAKYVGNRRLIETAIATLATDRALLLLGLPGTAKSWVSENLAAAITGSSQRLIQCTAGTDENQIRYSWNYALLLSKGPSLDALVKTPLARAMEDGSIVRLEELTRMGSEVQDTLITVLSEKTLPVPELDLSLDASRGFNVIATANNRDKGVNALSSALQRRFNVVVLPSPSTLEEETQIVIKRVLEIGTSLNLPEIPAADAELARLVTIFREIREGKTINGRTKLKTSTGSLSTAEAISVGVSAWAEAAHFGEGRIDARSLAANIVGAVVKDPVQDGVALSEYNDTIARTRSGWADLYSAIREVM